MYQLQIGSIISKPLHTSSQTSLVTFSTSTQADSTAFKAQVKTSYWEVEVLSKFQVLEDHLETAQ
jgi:hypothetical protein